MVPWVWAVGAAAFVILRVLLRSQARRHPGRALPKPPVARVHATLASVQAGELVKLTGQIARAQALLVAPISGRSCVGYAVVARVWHSKKVPQLIAEVREIKIAPLIVAVEGGEILVSGECDLAWPTRPLPAPIPLRESSFLASRKLERYAASTEFEEAIVGETERIWITGLVVHEQDGEHGYRDAPVTVRLAGRPGQPLTIGRAG